MKTYVYLMFILVVSIGVSCKESFMPVSDFYVDGKIIIKKPVQFVNQSGNSSEYLWDFGDKTTSKEKDPIHIYKKSGKYIVRLIAKNEMNYATNGVEVLVQNAANPTKEPDFVTVKSDVPLSQPVFNILPLPDSTGNVSYVIQAEKEKISLAYSDSSIAKYELLLQNWWTLKRIELDSIDLSAGYLELNSVLQFSDEGTYVLYENCTDTWKWGYWCAGAQSLDILVFDAGSIYERFMKVESIEEKKIKLSFLYKGKNLFLTFVNYDFY
jgi:hypothetical protein